ncbi:hypothetical protein CDD83_7126 [Cordyceps sp. RAO-2017]|nr:hypothetical protein CDD83_7126 [Cordyceps sp. RAO-2017]
MKRSPRALTPAPGPAVVGPVEAGRAEPVAHRQLARVADAAAALLGRVDDEEAAQRPEGLPAQVVGVLLVQDDGRHAALRQLEGGHEARQSRADDDDGRCALLLLLAVLRCHFCVFLVLFRFVLCLSLASYQRGRALVEAGLCFQKPESAC